MRRIILVLLGLLLAVAPASAWNKGGHMVSAAVAYAVLKAESPESIPKIIAMLKLHPSYDKLWLERLNAIPNLTDDEKDLYLFMQSARWADDIRPDQEFHKGEWHYINLPIKPAGQPDSVKIPAPASDNIIRAFEMNRTKAKTQTESDRDRAVALTWVAHLVGDAHQPLHSTSYYTTDYPKGDRGGNLFLIRVKAESSVIPLHQFWDDLIIGSERFQSVRNKATELRLREELLKPKLIELAEPNFEKWIKNESWKLASDVVYRNGTLAGSPDRDKAPALPADYVKTVKPIAERRIVLAGYRLADVFKQIVTEGAGQ